MSISNRLPTEELSPPVYQAICEQFKELQHQKQEVEKELHVAREQIANLAEQAKFYEEQNRKYESILTDYESQIVELEKSVESHEKAYLETKRASSELETVIQELQLSQQELLEELQESNAALESAQQNNNALNREIKLLRSDRGSLEQDTYDSLQLLEEKELAFRESQQEIERLTDKNNKLVSKIEQLSKKLEKASDNIHKLEEKASKYESQIHDFQDEITSVREEERRTREEHLSCLATVETAKTLGEELEEKETENRLNASISTNPSFFQKYPNLNTIFSFFNQVTSNIGSYLTTSTATVLLSKTLGLHPLASFSVTSLALLADKKNLDAISPAMLYTGLLGNIMAISDLDNYLDNDDINLRMKTLSVGLFITLCSHIALLNRKNSLKE